MFRIHREQVEAFASQMRGELERKIEELLPLNDLSLRGSTVHEVVDRALAYGFVSEAEVADYVFIEAVAGGDPALVWSFSRQVLSDTYLTSAGRLRVLRRRAFETGTVTTPIPGFTETR